MQELSQVKWVSSLLRTRTLLLWIDSSCPFEFRLSTIAKTMLIVLAIFIIAAVSSFLNVRKPDIHNVEVRVHENLANKRHIEVNIPDIVSLLHQVESDSSESGSITHQRINTELLSEERTSTDIPIISEPISSQPSSSSTQQATPSVEEGGPIPELKFELKVAFWVIPLSAGGIVGLVAGFPGNYIAILSHKILFKAYTWLTYTSFICGVGLFLLTRLHPKIQGLVIVARFTMWLSICSITYAIGFATCVLLLKGTVVVVLVLLVPLLLFVVIVILKFSDTRN